MSATANERAQVHLWAGRVAVIIALICVVLAAITGVTGERFVRATSMTLLLASGTAFLAAIWIAIDEAIEAKRR